MTTTYKFKWFFTQFGLAYAPTSAPVASIRNTATDSLVASSVAVTQSAVINGLCEYSYTGADSLDLQGMCTTSDTTVDRRTLMSYTPDILTTNLNGTISGLGARLPAALTANGNMKSSVLEWISTLFTEGATGRFAAALQGMFNVTNPVMTAQSVNQTQDNNTKISTILADYARRTGDYSTFAAGQQVDLVNAPNATAIAAIQSGLATPTNVWTRLTSLLTTSGSIGKLIVDMIDATISSRATPADVHTSIAISTTTAATVASGSLAIVAGVTFRQTITSTILDDLSAATQIELAFKTIKSVLDAGSTVLIKLSGGLVYLNGAGPYSTPAHGSLTVTGSSGAWSIAVYIDEVATDQLFGVNNNRMFAGVKAKIGGDWVEVWNDRNNASTVLDGVIRDVS